MSFANIGTIIDFSGPVKINNSIPIKNMIIKEKSSLVIGKNGYITIEYQPGFRETIRENAIISNERAAILIKYIKAAENEKLNFAAKGVGTFTEKELSQQIKNEEQIRLYFANSKYSEIIKIIKETKFDYNHPDNLFKVAFSYYMTGDIIKAQILFQKLLNYDMSEYNKIAQNIFNYCKEITTNQ